MFRLRSEGMLFGVATFADGGALLHIGVAFLTIFVRKILAEACNLSPFGFFVALLAILNSFSMRFVIEGDPLFHLDYVGGKC